MRPYGLGVADGVTDAPPRSVATGVLGDEGVTEGVEGAEGEIDAVGVIVGVTDTVDVVEGVKDGVGVFEGVLLAVRVTDFVGVRDAVDVGEGVAENEPWSTCHVTEREPHTPQLDGLSQLMTKQ